MTASRKPRTYDYVGSYGRAWRPGVLVDDVIPFVEAGGRLHRTVSGRILAVDTDGGAYPLVCADLIEVPTEDGPIVGRCGIEVAGPDAFACAGHTEERLGWLAMSEAERAAWERHAYDGR